MKHKKNYIFLTILTISITLGFLLLLNHLSIVKEPTWEKIQDKAKQGGYRLITSEELRTIYDNNPDAIMLIDVRQVWEYNTGFIARALSFPLEPSWWAGWRKKDALEKFIGPDRNITLVFY